MLRPPPTQQQQQQQLNRQSLYGGQQYAQTISRASNFNQQANNHQASSYYYQQVDFHNPTNFHQFPLSPQPPPQIHQNQRNSLTMNTQERNKLLLARHHRQLQQQEASLFSVLERQHALLNKPLCRCRVMYLGSSVPHITKNGLHGIQEPLRHLYPEEQFNSKVDPPAGLQQPQLNEPTSNTTIDISHLSSSLGIDSWLSVWSNGLLLENVDEFGREVKRFFSIESLHYCAAVRFFDTTTLMSQNNNSNKPTSSSTNEADESSSATEENQQYDSIVVANDQNNNSISKKDTSTFDHQELNKTSTTRHQQQQRKNVVRFLPLDAPLFQCPGMIDAKHPPVFAAIMRRTTGIKVLECHAFICRRDAAANALVRCCTQAYADLLNAKRLSVELSMAAIGNNFQHQQRHLGSQKRRAASACRANDLNAHGHIYQQTNGGGGGGDDDDHIQGCESGHSSSETTGTTSCATIKKKNSQQSTSTDLQSVNSLEASSDDNYAIISKSHHRNSKKQLERKISGGGGGIKPTTTKVGSSKSLFNDFMPTGEQQPLDRQLLPPCCNNKVEDIKPLSHSLNLLDIAGGGQECCQDLNCQKNDESNCCDYSTSTRKRYSKSMQNLEGPFEFSASEATTRSRNQNYKRSNRNHRRQNYSSEINGGSSSKGVKAQSIHDMRLSAARKNSLTSERSTSNHQVDDYLASSRNKPTATRRQQHSVQQPPSTTSRRSTSSKRREETPSIDNNNNNNNTKRVSRRARQQQEPAVNHQMLYDLPKTSAAPNNQQYYHQASYNKSSPIQQPANIYQPPQPQHLAPIYMPAPVPAGYYHHPLPLPQMAPYNAAGLYGPPQPALYDPYLHPPQAALMHHAFNYQHQVPFNHQQQYPMVTQYCLNNNNNLPVAAARKSRNSTAKSTLARFRCLSPPLNFLSGNTFAQQQQSGAAAKQQKSKRQSVALSEASASNRLSTITTNELQQPTTCDSNLSSPRTSTSEGGVVTTSKQVEIVSGEPGFISSSTMLRQKKMGWIKRLSLTMTTSSNNQQSSGDECSASNAGGTLTTDPNGHQTRSKKRSSIFSGSLTLGRNNNNNKQRIDTN